MRATLIFLMLIFCPTLAMAGDLSISDIQVIDLKDGPNTIPDFVPNGEEGMIVRGYRSNGNAHGYNVYMVMVPGKSKSSWLVVDTEQALKIDLPLDTLRDDPLTHENNAESVWFAKGKVDRKAASILLIAHRDLSHASNLYEAVATEIQIFILRDRPDSVGSTPFIFAQINDRLTTKKYQNTECALANELKLPVPTTVEIDCSTDGIQ